VVRKGKIRWLGLVSGAFVTASAPVTVSVERGVQPQVAECQSGTCCPEDKSTCVIGSNQNKGYYHQAEGPCVKQH
jgi:hypothetical protein